MIIMDGFAATQCSRNTPILALSIKRQ